MSDVAGSGYGKSVQLPSPSSFSFGLYKKNWQLMVTQSNGDVSSLIDVNKKTGLPYAPSRFTYIQTGQQCNNVIYYNQECTCIFC